MPFGDDFRATGLRQHLADDRSEPDDDRDEPQRVADALLERAHDRVRAACPTTAPTNSEMRVRATKALSRAHAMSSTSADDRRGRPQQQGVVGRRSHREGPLARDDTPAAGRAVAIDNDGGAVERDRRDRCATGRRNRHRRRRTAPACGVSTTRCSSLCITGVASGRLSSCTRGCGFSDAIALCPRSRQSRFAPGRLTTRVRTSAAGRNGRSGSCEP